MSNGRPPQGSIPTLTEVVTWPGAAAAKSAPAAPEPAPVAAPPPAPAASPAPTQFSATASTPTTAVDPPLDEAGLVQRVLGDIEKQVDLMLEVRLREALAPVLVRATDALVRDARKELTAALKDIVARSVARELGRRD